MKHKGKTVLVTGAGGFIGSFVTEHLTRTGYKVRSLTRREQTSKITGVTPHQVLGNLNDTESLMVACKGVDYVVHAAGLAHADGLKKSELFKANVAGTRNLIRAAQSQRVKRFVYISSSLASDVNQNGTANTAYGQTKLQAEKLAMAAHETGPIEAVIIRPVNVYGIGMKGNIPALIALADRWFLPALPVLNTSVSLISVEDLSRAIYLSINSENAAGKLYTVTDGHSYNINQIEEEIYRILGKKFPFLRLPRLLLYAGFFGVGGINKISSLLNLKFPSLSGIRMRTYRNLISTNLFDNSQIVQDLNFRPEVDLYQMLPRIVHSVIQTRANQSD